MKMKRKKVEQKHRDRNISPSSTELTVIKDLIGYTVVIA